MSDVMHRKRTRRIWGIWEKAVSWAPASEREGCLLELAEARPVVCDGGRTWWGRRWKSQHRKIVYHSPYVELPLNSKVIKSFVPELRSRKCFLCFGIPMLSIYELRTFYVRFTYPFIMGMLYNDDIKYWQKWKKKGLVRGLGALIIGGRIETIQTTA